MNSNRQMQIVTDMSELETSVVGAKGQRWQRDTDVSAVEDGNEGTWDHLQCCNSIYMLLKF